MTRSKGLIEETSFLSVEAVWEFSDRSVPPSLSLSLAPRPNDLTGFQRSLLAGGSRWLVLQGCNGCALLLALFSCWLFWGQVIFSSSFHWEFPHWSTFRTRLCGGFLRVRLETVAFEAGVFFVGERHNLADASEHTPRVLLIWPWGGGILAANQALLLSSCVFVLACSCARWLCL